MKTYIAQIINPHGNGYAIVNASNPKSVEDIIRNQSRFHNSIVASCRELVWKDADDSIIYEGAILTLGKSAYDLAVLTGYKGTLEEWLSSMKGVAGDDGNDGVSVQNVTLNPDNSFTFLMSNGSTITTDSIYIEGGGEGGQDGVGVQSIQTIQSTQESGGANIIRITLTNGNTFDFNVYNGAKGDGGDDGHPGNDGITPTITATAEVANTIGTPSVIVTNTSSDITAPNFKFSFSGIKGEPGSSSSSAINSISVNGIIISPVGGVVDITVPTSLPANGGNSSTVNNHTVNSNVPANAVFTDTQADWNENDTTSSAYINNKPNLATVATSGSYNDLSDTPIIPIVPTISTDVSADESSDVKTASPKAVKTYVDGICGTILTRLQGI